MLTSIIVAAPIIGIAVAKKLLKSATSKNFEVAAGENLVVENVSDRYNVIPEAPQSRHDQACKDSGNEVLLEKKVVKPQQFRKIFTPQV